MKVSLQDWLKNNWLTEYKTNAKEITEYFQAIDRDLQDSKLDTLSEDWRMAIAYSAALRAANTALAAEGFRASREQHHYRLIQSLTYTIEAEKELIAEFDQFRKKRNRISYEGIATTSMHEVNRIIELAEELQERVFEWMKIEHPDLIESL